MKIKIKIKIKSKFFMYKPQENEIPEIGIIKDKRFILPLPVFKLNENQMSYLKAS